MLVEIIDVSAEMAAQEALQEREELLRRLTDAMPVGLLQLDTDRNVVYNNAHLLEILHGAKDTTAAKLDAAAGAEATESAGVGAPAGNAARTLTEEGMADFESTLAKVLDEGTDQDIEVDFVLKSE